MTETTVRHSGACPDCDSDLRAVAVQPNVYVTTVFHDETCPRYQRMTHGRYDKPSRLES